MSDESLKPPDGLKTAGMQLWDSVTASFVLGAAEGEILRQACRTSDEITSLEAELRGSSLVVAGYSSRAPVRVGIRPRTFCLRQRV